MKLRSDFVSNSSSSSFVVNPNQSGFGDFLDEFKKLFSRIHLIICTFNSIEDKEKYVGKYLSHPEVVQWLTDHKVENNIQPDYNYVGHPAYDLHPLMMVENDQLFEYCKELIINSNNITLFLHDSWGDYNFTLHQILTLLEYKGFDFCEGFSEEGWVKMNLNKKETKNENQK